MPIAKKGAAPAKGAQSRVSPAKAAKKTPAPAKTARATKTVPAAEPKGAKPVVATPKASKPAKPAKAVKASTPARPAAKAPARAKPAAKAVAKKSAATRAGKPASVAPAAGKAGRVAPVAAKKVVAKKAVAKKTVAKKAAGPAKKPAAKAKPVAAKAPAVKKGAARSKSPASAPPASPKILRPAKTRQEPPPGLRAVPLAPKDPRAVAAMDELRRIAASHGGQLLSPAWKGYIGSASKLRFACAAGHEFVSSPHNIKIGRWCSICAKRAPITLAVVRAHMAQAEKERLAALATARGAAAEAYAEPFPALISKSMPKEGRDGDLRWRCVHGHEFKASWVSMRKREPDRRCLECAKLADGKRRLAAKKAEIERVPGARMLCDLWPGSDSKATFQCERGHQWEARIRSVKPPITRQKGAANYGAWCPHCYKAGRRGEL